MAHTIQRIISSLLAFQLAFGSSVLLYPTKVVAAETSSAQQARDAFSDDIDKFEKSLDQNGFEAPPPESKDEFLITKQKLFLSKTGREYSLSEINLELPEVIVTDQKEISVDADKQNGDLVFSITQRGQIVGRHTIGGTKAVAWTYDRELLVFLDQNGNYRAIDMGYATTQLGRSPIPVVHLLKSKINFHSYLDASGTSPKSIHLSFISRNQKPYKLIPADENGVHPLDGPEVDGQIIHAGNIAVTVKENGEDVLLEELSRNVIRTQVFTAESILGFLAARLDPEQFRTNKTVLGQVNNAPVILSDALQNLSSPEAETIASLSANVLKDLGKRAERNLLALSESSDRFQYEEWKSHFERIQSTQQRTIQEEKKGIRKVGAVLLQQIRKTLTPKAMKTIALITAGTAGSYVIMDSLHEGYGPAWAVHAVNQFYHHYVPEVLKDATYRATLIASSLSLGAFMPLLFGVGSLGAMIMKKSWGSAKVVAMASFRFSAEIGLLVTHRLAKVTRQESFLKMMRIGLNPLSRVGTESQIGKTLGLTVAISPGINSPFWNAKKFGPQAQLKSEAAKLLAAAKSRKKQLAWMLAGIVVSEDMNIDLPTLTAIASQQGLAMTAAGVAAFMESPEFEKKWEAMAYELQRGLKSLKDPALQKELETLSPEEIGRLSRFAREIATKVNSRKWVGKKWAGLRNKWKNAFAGVDRSFANFGLEEYEFLKRAEPSKFVYEQFKKQFLLDYSLAIVQMALIGDRAVLSDKQALAADANGPLHTNPGHLADMFGQVRIYGLGVPARLALVYQKAADIIESGHAPAEAKVLLGTEKSESLGKGMWAWFKGAADLSKANYGAIWLKSLVRSVKMIQAGFILNTVERMYFGGQGFSDATYALIYSMIWATWQFGWMWEPVTRGNEMYQAHLEERAKTLTNAKVQLSTAIRMDDPTAILNATIELKGLYALGKTELPENISLNLDKALDELGRMTPEEVMQLQTRFAQDSNDIARLRYALVSGDPEHIIAARIDLIDNYKRSGENIGTLLKLSSFQLLEHAIKHPPFATVPHKRVEWLTTMMGALLTTYYATTLAVETFRENVPWAEKIGEAAALSTGLYFAAYNLPRVIQGTKKQITRLKKGICALYSEGRLPPSDAWEP